jgi:hypothetical protein
MQIVRNNSRGSCDCRFLKIVGPWGEEEEEEGGWLFDTLPDGTKLLSELEASTMVDPSAEAVEPFVRD